MSISKQVSTYDFRLFPSQNARVIAPNSAYEKSQTASLGIRIPEFIHSPSQLNIVIAFYFSETICVIGICP